MEKTGTCWREQRGKRPTWASTCACGKSCPLNICTYIYIDTHVYTYTYMYSSLSFSLSIYMYMHICIYLSIYIYKPAVDLYIQAR